jgi:hypothetical protein
LAQDYPFKELIICDDSGQFDEQSGNQWILRSTPIRFPDLPAKFNYMAGFGSGQVLVVWEDDDIYLPDHLSRIAEEYMLQHGCLYSPSRVYTNYQLVNEGLNLEMAWHRFHSCWAYDRKKYDELGGYPDTNLLRFDFDMFESFNDYHHHYDTEAKPTFVYRFGNAIYHGSSCGPDHYIEHYKSLENMPAEHIGKLVPEFDKETTLLKSHAFVRHISGLDVSKIV